MNSSPYVLLAHFTELDWVSHLQFMPHARRTGKAALGSEMGRPSFERGLQSFNANLKHSPHAPFVPCQFPSPCPAC